ncbi:hypothetical protein [Stenomitos frigidus]|uniref:Uncharacterized protein n=1 Tax=Stenomitos frigidus ULC18 TaxID=2107698 RepID=A0A2T1EK75_9CYAN|nr:hypothetical protein [Stenomitos frigidus]PSB33068.1 hypothetical protein C7B82_04790 [Stenomitos frigidus ULC18]
MQTHASDPVLPTIIVPFTDEQPEAKEKKPSDLRDWQIEEFSRQAGKAKNSHSTQALEAWDS